MKPKFKSVAALLLTGSLMIPAQVSADWDDYDDFEDYYEDYYENAYKYTNYYPGQNNWNNINNNYNNSYNYNGSYQGQNARERQMLINGRYDGEAYFYNQTWYVPIDDLIENIGGREYYNWRNKTCTVQWNGNTITLTNNSAQVTINGATMNLSAKALLLDDGWLDYEYDADNLYVPVDFIQNVLKGSATFQNQNNRSILVVQVNRQTLPTVPDTNINVPTTPTVPDTNINVPTTPTVPDTNINVPTTPTVPDINTNVPTTPTVPDTNINVPTTPIVPDTNTNVPTTPIVPDTNTNVPTTPTLLTIDGQNIYQALRTQAGWKKLSYKKGNYHPNRVKDEIISYTVKQKNSNAYLQIEVDNEYNRYTSYNGKAQLEKLLTAATNHVATSKQLVEIADTAIRTGNHAQLRKKLTIGNYTAYIYVDRSKKGNEVKIYLGNQNFSLYR